FLANCLVQAGKSVMLIEGGGRVATTERNHKTAKSVGKLHTGTSIGRAMGLGGTSVLWGGQLAEFEETDLNREHFKWPITYDELRRWYDVVYSALGLDKRLSDPQYQPTFGGHEVFDADVERFFTVWLSNPNFATLFRRELVSNAA